jgi:hypothetical protein
MSGKKDDILRSARLKLAQTIESCLGETVYRSGIENDTGIIIAVVAGVVLLGVGLCFFWRNKA